LHMHDGDLSQAAKIVTGIRQSLESFSRTHALCADVDIHNYVVAERNENE